MEREPVRLVNETLRVSVWAVLLGWLARRLWRLLLLVLTSPSVLAVLAVLTFGLAVWHTAGPVPHVAAVVLLVGVLVVWRLR